MPAPARDRQISVRVPSETDAWLARRAGSSQNKAEFIRQLIERERHREREEKLLDDMFNEAAAHLGKDDLEERESLLSGFAAGQTD